MNLARGKTSRDPCRRRGKVVFNAGAYCAVAGRSIQSITETLTAREATDRWVLAAPERPLVLIVEDYADTVEIYSACLQFEGFRVVATERAEEALQFVQACPRNLIVMDVGLPGMTGWEATGKLKADQATRHIPVLIVTGHVFDEAPKRAAACRARQQPQPALTPRGVVGQSRGGHCGRQGSWHPECPAARRLAHPATVPTRSADASDL